MQSVSEEPAQIVKAAGGIDLVQETPQSVGLVGAHTARVVVPGTVIEGLCGESFGWPSWKIA
jgi:hypothetical protein